MKIGNGGYPLAQLPASDTRKTTRSRGRVVPADTAAAGVLSVIPGKALVRYLKAIEEITSDIMSIVDSDVAPVRAMAERGADSAGTIPPETLQDRPFAPGDALIVIPGCMRVGSDEGAAAGSITILRNVPFAGSGGTEGIDNGEAIVGLAKRVAAWLAPRETGIQSSSEMNPPVLEPGFIVSVRDGEGPSPVFSVRRQDMLEEIEVPDEAGPARQTTLVPVIRTLLEGSGNVGFTTPADTLGPDAFRVPGDSGSSQAIAGQTRAPARNESLLRSLLSFDPAEKVKENPSPTVPETSQTPFIGKGDGKEGASGPSFAEGPQSPALFAAKFRGVTVSVIDVRTGEAVSLSTDTGIDTITERMVDLSRVVSDLANLQDTDPEAGSDMTATRALLKETVTKMVKDSFVSVSGQLKESAFSVGTGAFGIAIDEKGGLKIDAVALKEVLAARKDEVVGLVREFASSVHDRIAYTYNPIAGVCRGGQESTLSRGPESKESLGEDEHGARADFEKRLSELQMLLRSSHELRDSFMRRKLAEQGG